MHYSPKRAHPTYLHLILSFSTGAPLTPQHDLQNAVFQKHHDSKWIDKTESEVYAQFAFVWREQGFGTFTFMVAFSGQSR